jgi:hypothetical protein
MRRVSSGDESTGRPQPTYPASESSKLLKNAPESPGLVASPESGYREIEEINRYKRPPGTFLNIGGDQADVLEIARMKGWYSAALGSLPSEVDDKSASHFVKVINRLKYDVVRLEGTLERADDPKQILDRISGVLHRRGLLVVSTPDCEGWDSPLFGQGATLFPQDLPKWFFTSGTLKRLLADCGYKVLKATSYHLDFQPLPRDGFSILPPDIGGDGAGGDFLPPQALPSVRYLRVLARVDEARASDTKRERTREPILREAMDPTEELILSLVE